MCVFLPLSIFAGLIGNRTLAQKIALRRARMLHTSSHHAPRAYRGTIVLAVTATDVDHQIFSVEERIPVQQAGPLTLLYPQWEPASHAPTASAADKALSVRLDVLADNVAQLTVTGAQEQMLQEAIAQTGVVFGPPPFRGYEMIVTLNDELGVGGVEHTEEGENNLPAIIS